MRVKKVSFCFILMLFFVGLFFAFDRQTQAFTDTKKGVVTTEESFQIPDLLTKSQELIDWKILSGETVLGNAVTVDKDGNMVSFNPVNGNTYYNLTLQGLEGSFAVGLTGDFDHILSYSELNNVCLSGSDFHSIEGHKDFEDGGLHKMVCSVYDKFKTIGCGFDCSHKNKYEYSFEYQIKKPNGWVPINGENIKKCEDIRLVFTPKAEWFASLNHVCTATEGRSDNIRMERKIDLLSPATEFKNCADQDTCLEQIPEENLLPGVYAKGVEQAPEDFIRNTQNSLSGKVDDSIKCDSSGHCQAYSSGKHTLVVTAPETKYYGQCRQEESSLNDFGETVTLPLVKISPPPVTVPKIKSAIDINVINSAPIASLSLSKNTFTVDKEIAATFDIVDPDSCADKIKQVKWSCSDDKNNDNECYFSLGDGVWEKGSLTINIPEDEQNFEYRSIVQFKTGKKGVYAISCEGADDDTKAQAIGKGVAGATVNAGVESMKTKNCSILPGEESTNLTVCGTSAKVKLKSYESGTDPVKYEWKCDKSEDFTEGADTKECFYSEEKIYTPDLRIFDDELDDWIECGSENNKIKVTNKAVCEVLVKPLDSKENYSKQVKINSGQTVEAIIKKECTKNEKPVWTTNGDVLKDSQGKETAKIKFNLGNSSYVKASIGGVECGGANVDVKENIKFGL